jgi:hypothetical protein
LSRALAAVVAVAGGLALASCTSMVDQIPPALGGLPEGAPERPAGPAVYPAVHDLPPRRAEVPLTEEEKKRLREELASSRDRAKGGPPPEPKAAGTERPAGADRTP